MTIRPGSVAAAALLLLAGCTTPLGTGIPTNEIDPTGEPTPVMFTAVVSGTARVQWSDGSSTHTQTVRDTPGYDWRSTIDSWRFVTAMTVVPVGAGSKASCLITVKFNKDDPDTWSTFADKSTAASQAAVCIQTGEADPPELGNPPTVTLTASSQQGNAQWRAQTQVGNVEVKKLAADEQRQFDTTGTVQMVVVAQKANDTVTCDIHTGAINDPGTRLDASEASGLGAIATCTATIPK